MTMSLLFLIFIFMMNMLLLMVNHPIAMGLVLVIQTIFISVSTGILYSSFWFSYILFLIFLGGLLVLFIYIASLASNEMFSIPFKSAMFIGLLILIIMVIMMTVDTSIMPMKMFNNEMKFNLNLNNSIFSSISKFYVNNITPTTMILIMYLFLTLIVTVKITNISSGPLRKLIN